MTASTSPTPPTPPAPAPQILGIQGQRIRLLPLDAALHLDNYLRWFNDPEVTRYLSRSLPMTRPEEEAFFKRPPSHPPTDVVWAVHDEHDRHIGGTGLHRIDWLNRSALSGTVIGEKSAWRQGYGTEIMRLRTRWAFEELGLHRIESECFVDNEGSAACLERAGYRRIGTAREKHYRNGRWHDAILWEILASDWQRSSGEQRA